MVSSKILILSGSTMFKLFFSGLFSGLLLLGAGLHAGDIEQYLKPAPNKSAVHSMKNVDFIYTINLDERPEKFAHCLGELKPYGITPYRFSAVNGWTLTLDDLNELGVKYQPGMRKNLWGTCYLPGINGAYHEVMSVPGRNYFCHCMTRGAIGIVLSHMSILKDALDSGYKTIWVMEDDIQVIQNPNMIPEMIDKLDKLTGKRGWDILFTDQDTKNQKGEYVECRGYAHKPDFTPKNPGRFARRVNVSPDFRKIGARFGAYSMIVRRSGMKKIYNFIRQHKIFLPYDIEFFLPNDIKMYTVRNDIVSTLPNALSDNGAPRYNLNSTEEKENNQFSL